MLSGMPRVHRVTCLSTLFVTPQCYGCINHVHSMSIIIYSKHIMIIIYKVLWSNHEEEDATWETEDYLKEVYKTFFENQ